MRTEILGRRVLSGVFALMLWTAVAFGQSRVRVTSDRTIIWTSDFLTVATHVDRGAELEVVGRRANWYEVVVPIDNGRRITGFIADVNVESIDVSLEPREGRPNERPQPATAPPREQPVSQLPS